MVVDQSWPASDPESERGYNLRVYFGPAYAPGTYYTSRPNLLTAAANLEIINLINIYESSSLVIHLSWNRSHYEFASQGALQSGVSR